MQVQALVRTVNPSDEQSLRAILALCRSSRADNVSVSDRLIHAPVGVMYLVVHSILAFDCTCNTKDGRSYIGLLWDLIECTPTAEYLRKVARAGGYDVADFSPSKLMQQLDEIERIVAGAEILSDYSALLPPLSLTLHPRQVKQLLGAGATDVRKSGSEGGEKEEKEEERQRRAEFRLETAQFRMGRREYVRQLLRGTGFLFAGAEEVVAAGEADLDLMRQEMREGQGQGHGSKHGGGGKASLELISSSFSSYDSTYDSYDSLNNKENKRFSRALIMHICYNGCDSNRELADKCDVMLAGEGGGEENVEDLWAQKATDIFSLFDGPLLGQGCSNAKPVEVGVEREITEGSDFNSDSDRIDEKEKVWAGLMILQCMLHFGNFKFNGGYLSPSTVQISTGRKKVIKDTTAAELLAALDYLRIHEEVDVGTEVPPSNANNANPKANVNANVSQLGAALHALGVRAAHARRLLMHKSREMYNSASSCSCEDNTVVQSVPSLSLSLSNDNDMSMTGVGGGAGAGGGGGDWIAHCSALLNILPILPHLYLLTSPTAAYSVTLKREQKLLALCSYVRQGLSLQAQAQSKNNNVGDLDHALFYVRDQVPAQLRIILEGASNNADNNNGYSTGNSTSHGNGEGSSNMIPITRCLQLCANLHGLSSFTLPPHPNLPPQVQEKQKDIHTIHTGTSNPIKQGSAAVSDECRKHAAHLDTSTVPGEALINVLLSDHIHDHSAASWAYRGDVTTCVRVALLYGILHEESRMERVSDSEFRRLAEDAYVLCRALLQGFDFSSSPDAPTSTASALAKLVREGVIRSRELFGIMALSSCSSVYRNSTPAVVVALEESQKSQKTSHNVPLSELCVVLRQELSGLQAVYALPYTPSQELSTIDTVDTVSKAYFASSAGADEVGGDEVRADVGLEHNSDNRHSNNQLNLLQEDLNSLTANQSVLSATVSDGMLRSFGLPSEVLPPQLVRSLSNKSNKSVSCTNSTSNVCTSHTPHSGSYNSNNSNNSCSSIPTSASQGGLGLATRQHFAHNNRSPVIDIIWEQTQIYLRLAIDGERKIEELETKLQQMRNNSNINNINNISISISSNSNNGEKEGTASELVTGMLSAVSGLLASKQQEQVDKELVERVQQTFGCTYNGAKRSCLATGSQGLQNALEWAVLHCRDPDFDLPPVALKSGSSGPKAGPGVATIASSKVLNFESLSRAKQLLTKCVGDLGIAKPNYSSSSTLTAGTGESTSAGVSASRTGVDRKEKEKEKEKNNIKVDQKESKSKEPKVAKVVGIKLGGGDFTFEEDVYLDLDLEKEKEKEAKTKVPKMKLGGGDFTFEEDAWEADWGEGDKDEKDLVDEKDDNLDEGDADGWDDDWSDDDVEGQPQYTQNSQNFQNDDESKADEEKEGARDAVDKKAQAERNDKSEEIEGAKIEEEEIARIARIETERLAAESEEIAGEGVGWSDGDWGDSDEEDQSRIGALDASEKDKDKAKTVAVVEQAHDNASASANAGEGEGQGEGWSDDDWGDDDEEKNKADAEEGHAHILNNVAEPEGEPEVVDISVFLGGNHNNGVNEEFTFNEKDKAEEERALAEILELRRIEGLEEKIEEQEQEHAHSNANANAKEGWSDDDWGDADADDEDGDDEEGGAVHSLTLVHPHAIDASASKAYEVTLTDASSKNEVNEIYDKWAEASKEEQVLSQSIASTGAVPAAPAVPSSATKVTKATLTGIGKTAKVVKPVKIRAKKLNTLEDDNWGNNGAEDDDWDFDQW